MPEATGVRRVASASTIRDFVSTSSDIQSDIAWTGDRRRTRTVRLPRVGRSAAFFDLDKTVIAKSSALAFGKPFYRDGLITRREAMKAAYAHLGFKLNGADDASIAKIRDYLAELSKGWSAEQVRQIVDETLHELIKPYVYAEAAALIAEHQANGRDIVLVSASGEEFVRPIGAQLEVSDVI